MCIGGFGGVQLSLKPPDPDAHPLKETHPQVTTICTPFEEARPHRLTCLVLPECLAWFYRRVHKGSLCLRDLPQPFQVLQNRGEAGTPLHCPGLVDFSFQPFACDSPPDRYTCYLPLYHTHHPLQVSPRTSRHGGFRDCALIRPSGVRLTA